MGEPKMPRPHFCRGMEVANAEIARLKEERDQAIDRVERLSEALAIRHDQYREIREANIRLGEQFKACVQDWRRKAMEFAEDEDGCSMNYAGVQMLDWVGPLEEGD